MPLVNDWQEPPGQATNAWAYEGNDSGGGRGNTAAAPDPYAAQADDSDCEYAAAGSHAAPAGRRGVREAALNLHHRPDAIRDALGDGSALNLGLRYSVEERLLGTAGGVKRMEPFLDETFLVLYGDNLWQADFAPLIAFHREKRATATIATFKAKTLPPAASSSRTATSA